MIPETRDWQDDVFKMAAIDVQVLRLDLLHPTVSGNKWLKLKGYLKEAVVKEKKGVLTKGGPWSNHVHACAFACTTVQLQCHLWIRGNEKYKTATLDDCARWGATVRFINRQVFYDETQAQAYAGENDLLYIPMGGADETGMLGVTNSFGEIGLPAYSHAICSVGTGTTMAGIAFVPNNFPHITGIESGTKDAGLQPKITGWQHQLPHKKLELMYDFSFGGFSRYNEELIDFMNQLYLKQQVPTDIVYTGKLFFAVQQMAAKSLFPAGSKLLVIHSGGLQGNRSLPAGLLQF